MKRVLALTLALACATGAAMAQDAQTGHAAEHQHAGHQALTEQQIRERLTEQGYTKINDVKFSDGVWLADARSADGNRMEVRVDPKTGKVYPNTNVANMSEKDVLAALAAQGYTNVHDVDFEDGIWNAEGDDPTGKDVELKIDPVNGKVIGKEKD